MAGERRFTRIPPESSGDRVSVTHSYEVPYDGLQNNHIWKVGETYLISGNPGGIPGPNVTFTLNSVNAIDATSGVLHITFDDQSMYEGDQILEDQDILYPDVGGSIVATVNIGFYSIYVNNQQIVGRNNPEYGVNVDRFGGMYTRFSEGAPELSSFNKLRTTEPTLIAQYDFSTKSYSSQFATSQEGSGETIWKPDKGAVELSSILDGDRATYTSNLFHPVVPSAGTFYTIATRLGSAGSENDSSVRFWGAFDLTDGFLFGLSAEQLFIEHRWTHEGTTSRIRVNQQSWNVDTVDGSGNADNPSAMDLDVTKINNYWVDYQHYGGGRVRWGVFYRGERIVCHSMDMSNGLMSAMTDYNAVGLPNRPVCWACAKNQGAFGGIPSDSEDILIYAHGAGVFLEADVDVLEQAPLHFYSSSEKTIDKNSTGTQYFFTLRPQVSLPELVGAGANNLENHTLYGPQNLETYSYGERFSITSLTIATNELTAKTSSPHYLSLSADVDIYNGGSANGRYKVSEITDPYTFVAPAPGGAAVGPISADMVGPKDDDTDERTVEFRLFSKCILRGEAFSPVNFSSAEVDTYADHLSHGPEFTRFVAKGNYDYDFNRLFKTIQNGTVYSASDQPFARSFQELTSLVGNNDLYTTGVDRVYLEVKNHPIWSQDKHYFNDKSKVIIRRRTRDAITKSKVWDNTSANTITNADYPSISNTESVWMYMSFLDRNKSWLYRSIADIDDDRSVRVLECDVDPSAAIAVGNKISLGGATGPTASVKVIYQHNGGTWYIGLEGRGNDNAGGTTWSAATDALTNQDIFITGGADTTINAVAITLSSDRIGGTGDFSGWDEADERTTFDLDYKTSLLAISSNGSNGETAWSSQNDDIASIQSGGSQSIIIYGPPPFQPAWTFMGRSVEQHKTDTKLRMTMKWKERTQ